MTSNDIFLTRINRNYRKNSLKDVREETAFELRKFQQLIKAGSRICIGVGSRGIRDIKAIVEETALFIRSRGAFPFVIPAMGSHGDASASGQSEILAGYGISEAELGIPVMSSMEVVELERGNSIVPVYMDKYGWESDGIILINRIKPHTDYHSVFESGLVKMSVIGLGKEKQASAIHRYGVYGLSALIPMAAGQVLATGKILGGIAIVENACDETMTIRAMLSAELLDMEPELLQTARDNMPSLPLDNIDLLVVDKMGKDISGVGLDPNIIGRIKISGQEEPVRPAVKAILITDLTEASHGNAIGVGLADVITKKLYDKIDFSSTYTNGITSSFLERIKIPVVAGTDRQAFGVAMRSCGYIEPGMEKIIRIKDTLHLSSMYVSQAVLEEIRSMPDIEIEEEAVPMFTGSDELTPF